MTTQRSDDGFASLHRSYAQAICKALVPWAVSKDLGRAKAPTVHCIEYLDPSGSGPQPPGTHAATPSAERAPRALDAMHGNISGSVTFAALTCKISLISAYPCPMHATQDPLAEPLSSSTAANPLLSSRTRRATLHTHASAALIRPRSETHISDEGPKEKPPVRRLRPCTRCASDQRS